MGRLLLIAVRNLLLNRRRSLLLGGAVTAVTLLLILMAAIGHGIRTNMLEAGTTLMCGHVNVGGFYKITSTGQASPILVRAGQLIRDVREALPEATRIIDRSLGFGTAVSESDSTLTGFTGVDPGTEQELASFLHIIEGDFAALADHPHSIVLFKQQTDRLKISAGDEITITSPVMKGQTNSLDVRVVAIAQDMGLISIMTAFVPKQTLVDLYEVDPDTTGIIQVYLPDPSKAAEAEARVRTALADKGYPLLDLDDRPFWVKFEQVAGEDWTGMKLDLTTWEGQLADMKWTLNTFETVTSILITVLLIIIILGVMNTMWITIRDRTREIGTLRAIGMGRGRLLAMFLLETIVLSAVASGLGVGLGVGLVALLNAIGIPVSQGFQIFLMSDTLKMVVSPASVVAALVVVPLLTTVGALFPAWRGARMRPVTAMHHVG